MNSPPDEYIPVREEDELEFVVRCLCRAGDTVEDAQVTGRLLVNCDLRGVRSHGISRAPGYCRLLKEGQLNPAPQMGTVHQTATAVVIDGDGGLGYAPSVEATRGAIAKAREVGIGMGLARHIGHYGAAGHYTRMCLEAGCIGFSVQSGRGAAKRQGVTPKPSVAFTGAPAMSFALPGGDEPDVVVDMVAHALSRYHGEGYEDLPERIPGAFFKSMGLVATAALMGGGLTGFTLPAGDEMLRRWPGATRGGMVLAIDVASVLRLDVFQAEVDEYTRDVRESLAPMPGFDEVMLPGTIEERTMERYRAEGIRFGEREQEAAREMSQYLDVALPWRE